MAELVSAGPQTTITLPRPIVEVLQQFERSGLSGWVQLNFNSGRLESWQIHEHRRV